MVPEDFNEWLRDVRPPTEADQGWVDGDAGRQALENLQARVAENPKRSARQRARRRLWIPSVVLAGAAAVVVVLAGMGTFRAGGSGDLSADPGQGGVRQATSLPNLPGVRPAAMLLSYDRSCASLLSTLRKQTAAHVASGTERFAYSAVDGGVGVPGSLGAAAGTGAKAPVAAQDSSGATSSTNVQEIGVDEPDLVKSDGDRVVSVTDGVLRVQDAATGAITGRLDLSIYSGAQQAQLFVNGDHALVILGSTGGFAPGGPAVDYIAPTNTAGRSTYLFVELAGTPRVTGSLRASGGYLDARMVGTTIRLVVGSTPRIAYPALQDGGTPEKANAAYEKAVMAAPLSAWLPSYDVTVGDVTTSHTVSCNQIAHPDDFSGESMLSIYTLDLTHLEASMPEPTTVAADGDTVYANNDSLYIASNPQWWTAGASRQTTEVHRFDISSDTTPTYLGSGKFPGRLLDSYALSEYDAHLRVATTSDTATQQSSVYVLDSETLKVTGHVDGLGKGEQIYAVRFVGPLAYVVTFRQTDPLYVVDLHNPAKPAVSGELELTGYSDYLHDAGDGRLIGVGQEANSQGRVAGMQVSLFDVSDPTKPSRADRVVLPTAVGESDVDPHAFLYWQPTGLVVAPLDSWNASNAGSVVVLSVSGSTLTKRGVIANPHSASVAPDSPGILRSFLVNGELWTLSGAGTQITDPDSLKQQSWVPFS